MGWQDDEREWPQDSDKSCWCAQGQHEDCDEQTCWCDCHDAPTTPDDHAA
jgi:hypothetical protein